MKRLRYVVERVPVSMWFRVIDRTTGQPVDGYTYKGEDARRDAQTEAAALNRAENSPKQGA